MYTSSFRIPSYLWGTLQRQNTEISKQIFPEKEYRDLSPNFHIHSSLSDLYIPTIIVVVGLWLSDFDYEKSS